MSLKLNLQLQKVGPLFFLFWVSTRCENVTCSNRCQLQDKDSTCWLKARTYYLHELITAINNYASVETMIHIWQTHQGVEIDGKLNVTFSNAIDVVNDNEGGPLSVEDLVAIFDVINNKTKNAVSSADSSTLSISCPSPCDYVNTLWIYLFVCSCIVVLLTIPI
uniref:Uncharacterized protein n=1 Tax=Strigamia maritima TaxID=126957 RepID=T1J3Z1_STRMM